MALDYHIPIACLHFDTLQYPQQALVLFYSFSLGLEAKGHA